MKKAFTLIEMIIVTVILGIILTVTLTIYFNLLKIKTDVAIRTNLVKSTNNIVEKLNIMMKNYTIDYEEYFDRKVVGCNSNGGSSFSWDVGTGGYCTKFTNYGNGNSVDLSTNTGNNILYYCTSHNNGHGLVETPGGSDCNGDSLNGITGDSYIYEEKNSGDLSKGIGCVDSMSTHGIQSFGEYKQQFWDVNANADGTWGCRGDDDDTDLGIGPDAIADNGNIRELYLISKDGKKRTFFRRKLVGSGDFNHNGTAGDTTGENLYKLQMLKLRGFDIGSGHTNSTGPTTNDGKIDTWACDAKEGFYCNGVDIGGGYSNYNLPKDIDDGWADITSNNISIDKFDLTIYPEKDSNYAWSTGDYQIAPYIKMSLKTRFYPVNYQRKVNPNTVMNYKMDIQTDLSIKPY